MMLNNRVQSSGEPILCACSGEKQPADEGRLVKHAVSVLGKGRLGGYRGGCGGELLCY